MKRRKTSTTGRKITRFQLRNAEGAMPLPQADGPGAALSRAITEATKRDAEPGVWEVIEYEDVIYRVHNLEGPKLDVRIETVR